MASNAHLAKIHIAKKQLAMDDETYRAMLTSVAGVESSKNLTVPLAMKVLAHLERCGFKAKPPTKAKTRVLADDAQSKMIRGLWIELADMEIVRNSSEAALAGFVKRMTKVDALQWLSSKQASQVIEHLKEWLDRVNTQRKAQLLAALALPVAVGIEAVVYQHQQLQAAITRTLGRAVDLSALTETDFKRVLQAHTKVKE
ncbi:gp16 family protein [uncultured Deefgea sp.]|uniref:gp16 family protein n=1 Tax=uncultured Deefgea sp. TaxID=1304914 RepID=UPI002607C976|nr:regulatory protein GemA [uncultured Deefgea sp.]